MQDQKDQLKPSSPQNARIEPKEVNPEPGSHQRGTPVFAEDIQYKVL